MLTDAIRYLNLKAENSYKLNNSCGFVFRNARRYVKNNVAFVFLICLLLLFSNALIILSEYIDHKNYIAGAAYDGNDLFFVFDDERPVSDERFSMLSLLKHVSYFDVIIDYESNIFYRYDETTLSLFGARFTGQARNEILVSNASEYFGKSAVILGDQTLYVAGNHTFDRCYVNEYYAKDKTAQGFVLEIEPSTSQDQIENVIDEVRKIFGNLNCSLNSADVFEEAEQSIHAAEAGISLFAGITAWIITLAVLIAALLKTDKIFKLVGATVADRAGVCILITIFVLTVSCLPSAVLFYALLM